MNANQIPPEVMTVAEIAAYLRVSEITIWRWCSNGKLPAFRIGRSWRVRRADLDTMIVQTPEIRAVILQSEQA